MVMRLSQGNQLLKHQLMMIPELIPLYLLKHQLMRQSEFHGCFGGNVEENSNNTDEDEEEVNLDNNYDYLSQLRVNKKLIRYELIENYKL